MSDLHNLEIRREGRSWSRDEADRAYRTIDENPDAPGRLEMVGGKVYHHNAQRITMLGWRLEMVDADAAVRLGDPEVWRAAVAGLSRTETTDR